MAKVVLSAKKVKVVVEGNENKYTYQYILQQSIKVLKRELREHLIDVQEQNNEVETEGAEVCQDIKFDYKPKPEIGLEEFIGMFLKSE